MKKNNKGFSLVEFIIVIAIMAIAAGIGFYSFSNVGRYRAKECSKKISSNLEQVKITSLGKAKNNGDYVWELYRSGNSFYVRYCSDCPSAHNEHDVRKISKGRVEVSYIDAGGTEVPIEDGEALKLCFNRSTGAIYSVDATNLTGDGMKSTAGSGYSVNTNGLTGVSQIVVRGGGRDYVTELIPATGKIVKR